MINIIRLFDKYKVSYIRQLNLQVLDSKDFPKKFKWIYDLLLIIPIVEQAEREDFIKQLPNEVIFEVNEDFERHENELTNWYATEPFFKGKYYAGLVQELISERYTSLAFDENFFNNLNHYKNAALTEIEKNNVLKERYEQNKSTIHVSNVFDFIAPILYLINDHQDAQDWYNEMPREILDVASSMVGLASDYLEMLIEEHKGGGENYVMDRIKIMREASSLYIDSIF